MGIAIGTKSPKKGERVTRKMERMTFLSPLALGYYHVYIFQDYQMLINIQCIIHSTNNVPHVSAQIHDESCQHNNPPPNRVPRECAGHAE